MLCLMILMTTRILMMDLYACVVIYVKSYADACTVPIIIFHSLLSQVQIFKKLQ